MPSSAASARRTTIRKPSAQFPSTVRSPEFIVGYLIAPGLDFCDCQFPLQMTEVRGPKSCSLTGGISP